MKTYYSLKSYFWYLKQFKVRIIAVFVAFLFANACITAIPVFVGRLVGAATTHPINTHSVWINVIFLIACSTLHDFSWRSAEIAYMKYINPLTFRYENEIFRQVIAMPYPFFVGKFTGKIAHYVTLLGKELHEFVDRTMYNYAGQSVRLVGITLILFTVNTFTGLVFLLAILLMLLIGRHTIKNSIKYESDYTDVESTKNGKIIDIMSNFVNVKSFNKEHEEHAFIKKEQEKVIKSATRSFTWALVFWGSMSFFVRNLIWPLTIGANVFFYLNGQLSVAELTTAVSTIMLFSDYIWEMIWNVSQFNLKVARMEEAHRYLFGNKAVHAYRDFHASIKINELDLKNDIEIKNLNFAYPDQPDRIVLHNINLRIKKGEKIGIVGHSGGGKTTIVKLLLGYYDIKDGEIFVDGKGVSSKDLLSCISYVPQDTTLFNRTIAENISYAASDNASRHSIEEVSKLALVDEFIQKIPKKYDAIVGERGVKLSTGQRQRIAIARAMLQDKPLLILDEATSALDSENEQLVQKSLENLWQDRTVISIAHRLSTLRKMDRILVFEDGKIVETGSIKELLQNKGVFYDLWNHQVNGMIVE